MLRALFPFSVLATGAPAALLACLVLVGCEPPDPLEAIRQQQEAGDLEGSLEPLRELLAERPDDPEANYRYGRALAMTGRPSLATWSLRKAMEDPEWLVAAATQLAFGALATRDFNEVVDAADRILAREPDNTTALLLRAQAHAHWRKDPEQALADATRVLELSPTTLEAYEPLILALIALDRHEEGSEKLAEAGRRMEEVDYEFPRSTQAWHCATTAVFADEEGDLERARSLWAECLEKYPAEAEVVWPAVKFYDRHREPQRSLDVLRAALAEAPASRPARAALADRLRAMGQTAEAEAVLREATRSDDPAVVAGAWLDLAKLRHDLGEHAAAVDAIRRAIDAAQSQGLEVPDLVFQYAESLVLTGQLDRALQVAEEEISIPAHQRLVRARVAQERRNPAAALAEFDEALRLWPNNAGARYYAALAAEELGQFDRALEEYRYAIRVNPSGTDAQTRAAQMLAAEGKAVQALQLLRTNTDPATLRPAAQLLSMRLAARVGEMPLVRRSLEKGHPAFVGPAAAAAAEGVAERSGPEAAARMLENTPGVDLTDPRNAEALRAYVRFAHEAGDAAAAESAVEAALAAHPESGALHEVRGLDLELRGAAPDAVKAAYERALELAPNRPGALAGLGRLALADDPEEALGLFNRAAAADPSDPAPQREAARALIAAGRGQDAATRLDALLLAHPYDAEAAALRARLDLERGVAAPRTLERAERAVRFGGGAEALELLSQVHTRRDEPESAARAAERARALRKRQASEG